MSKEERARATRAREKSRAKERDHKNHSSKNSSFELAPTYNQVTRTVDYEERKEYNKREMGRIAALTAKSNLQDRLDREEKERKKREEARMEKERLAAEERKMKEKWIKHDVVGSLKRYLDGDKNKSEEIDTEAKKRLQDFGDMDTIEEKVEYIYSLIKTPTKPKRGMTEEEEGKNEKRERSKKIAYTMLSHLLPEDLDAIVSAFKIKYPTEEISTSGDITNSSLLRSTFAAKRAFLKTALELSLAPSSSTVSAPASSFTVSAFDEKGFAKKNLILQELDKDELTHPIVPFYSASTFSSFIEYGMRSIIPSFELFKEVFNVFTNNFFEGIDLQGSVVAGGSVMASLLPLPPRFYQLYNKYKKSRYTLNKIPLPSHVLDHIDYYCDEPSLKRFREELSERFLSSEGGFNNSDIDIFILANTLQEGKTKLENLYNSITHKYNKLGLEFCVVRTPNSVTICSQYPYRHIQLIISLLRNVDDFLLFADLDCTSCVYTGKQVLMSPRSVRAFNKRYNVMPPKSFINMIDKARMLKYVSRGFSSIVFELCKHTPRCDVELDQVTCEHLEGLEYKRSHQHILHSREAYVDLRLPFGPHYDLESVREAANDSSHACLVGNNLREVFDSEDFVEKFEEALGKRAKEIKEEEDIKREREEEKGKKKEEEEEEEDNNASTERVQAERPNQYFGRGSGRGGRGRGGRGGRGGYRTIGIINGFFEGDEKGDEKGDGGNNENEAEGGTTPEETQWNVAETEETIEEDRKITLKSLRGIRWKVLDTLASRKGDDILPRCYMCRIRFLPTTHEQVGLSLCLDCVKKNNAMFEQWNNLIGLEDLVAVVTGARIKIGYHTALRLLRSEVTVVAVTRFPNDAARRYSLEPDYDNWKHKLHIYGVDLRHLPSVNEFISHVAQKYKRIDILINNAAQTIRRPRAYYRTLIDQERLLNSSDSFAPKLMIKSVGSDPFLIESGKSEKNETNTSRALVLSENQESMLSVALSTDNTLPKSAALSQVKMLPMDLVDRDDDSFPPGQVDEHNEQLDLRAETSWTQSIEQISTVELMEVQIVNSTVPFMLISSFTPLLKNAAKVSKFKRSFVVNVTSAEGVFNMNKRGIHPHTNMAKAALNMMTKSIAVTFAATNIFATAVDTGWVTKMKPGVEGLYPTGDRGATAAPLSDKDGAARVLHPVFVGLTSTYAPPYGVLYRNFEVSPWN